MLNVIAVAASLGILVLFAVWACGLHYYYVNPTKAANITEMKARYGLLTLLAFVSYYPCFVLGYVLGFALLGCRNGINAAQHFWGELAKPASRATKGSEHDRSRTADFQ